MTEFGPGLFALAPEDAIRKAGSIGRPNFFIDARIVDRDNRPLAPNQVGELVLKGPSIASGYFNNPAAWAGMIDQDGWFHTGDLARHDEDWYFYIVDRLKDMFISGGENVYPAEIEAALYKHPAVFQCAVVGVPDPKWGEVGKVFVVLKPGPDSDRRGSVGASWRATGPLQNPPPRRVFGCPADLCGRQALPISAAGKVLRRELRERQ